MRLKKLLRRTSGAQLANALFIPAFFILAAAVFYALCPSVFAASRLSGMIGRAARLLIIASGLTIVMLSGGIDLSIGGQVSLCLAFMALLSGRGVSPLLVILGGLLVGSACGAFNGLLTAFLRIPPFIATLAGSFIFVGIGRTLLTRGVSFGFRDFFARVMGGSLVVFRPEYAIAILCVVITALLINRTCWGRYVIAIGLDEGAVRRAGISVVRVKWRAYLINGLFCAIGAFVLSGEENIAVATVDVDLTLAGLAAVALSWTDVIPDAKRVARMRAWKLTAAVLLLELLSSGFVALFPIDYTKQILLSAILLASYAHFLLGRDRSRGKALGV